MAQLSWIPAFEATSDWLSGYENRQTELVTILSDIGIDKGLTDKLADGSKVPLTEIDPFSFFSLFMKYGVERRKTLFASFLDSTGFPVQVPTDFDGVPSAQALKVWLFPYADTRKPEMIAKLWQLFNKAKNNKIDSDLFESVLRIPNVGFAKLTQCLFYAFPEQYFPIDSQTRPWLEKQGIAVPTAEYGSYKACLQKIRDLSNESFAMLSYIAWSENQKLDFNALNAMNFLEERYPGTYAGTSHIAAYSTESRRELAFDPGKDPNKKRKVMVFVDELPPASFSGVVDYPPTKTRNSNLRSNARTLAVGKQAYSVPVGSFDELKALCNWYESGQEDLTEIQEPKAKYMNEKILNQIIYGPPGTGKTYATTEIAVKTAEPNWYLDLNAQGLSETDLRNAMKQKYDELVAINRIAFLTFHQSLSYEDFVEGIRAITDANTNSLQYKIEDGIFKRIADEAARSTGVGTSMGLATTPKIWKISIGPRHENDQRNRCINQGEARIGWNSTGDLSLEYDERSEKEKNHWNTISPKSQGSIKNFSEGMQVGDILLCLEDAETIQAVGIVTSDYWFDKNAGEGRENEYCHVRDVNWILKDIHFNILPINHNKRLVQQTLYQLDRINWDDLRDELEKQGYALPSLVSEHDQPATKPNYVLIIDEINRGNISRIFGELITLLEPDKRKGGSDAREVHLPYSKLPFSVPSNLYVIGTMNTADKSLAQLDLALRRRFEFHELLPNPNLLNDIDVYGVSLGKLLSTINKRIEVLLDRDHTIGHSYFWPLKTLDKNADREQALANIFKRRIIPLLQEYFFSDWERIGWVLNDLDKDENAQFIQLKEGNGELNELFSAKLNESLTDRRYAINEHAFSNPEAYRKILTEVVG